MADFSDLIGKSGKDLQANGTFCLRAVEATVGALAGITSIIGIPATILSLVSAFEKNSTPELLQDIAQKLNAALQFDHGEATVVEMRQIVTILTASRSRLQVLIELGVTDPQASTAAAFDDTLNTVNTLADQSFWVRPFFVELLFANNWFGKVMPPGIQDIGGGQSLVFDYRLTLPAFMEAIGIRLSVLALIRKDFPASFQAEMTANANTLEKYRQRIMDGFVTGGLPPIDEIAYTGGLGGSGFDNPPFFVNPPRVPPTGENSSWDFLSRTFGVVDSYEGFGAVDSWPLSEFPNPATATIPLSDPSQTAHTAVAAQYSQFQIRHTLATQRRRMSVYVSSGLDSVWACVQHLRKLGGVPVEILDLNTRWSLRALNTTLGSTFKDPSAPPEFVHVTARDTIRRLAMLGGLFTGLSIPGLPKQPLSWRQALAAAVP